MSHYKTAEPWPEAAYAGPVVGKQDPDHLGSDSPNGMEAPKNPVDFNQNQQRHASHTDENAKVSYDQYGRGDGSVGMNKIMDGTYQQPSTTQPGIGTLAMGYDGGAQVDASPDASSDVMDNWPELIKRVGHTSDALEVRVAPNRQLLCSTILIRGNLLTIGDQIRQVLANDPRRQRATLINTGASAIWLAADPGQLVNNLLLSGNPGADAGAFYLPNGYYIPLVLSYDGALWATCATLTSSSISIAIERDR